MLSCRAIDNLLITYCNLSITLILILFIMKKINLKGISEVLSEKELKNVMGGSYGSNTCSYNNPCSSSSDWCVNGYCQKR